MSIVRHFILSLRNTRLFNISMPLITEIDGFLTLNECYNTTVLEETTIFDVDGSYTNVSPEMSPKQNESNALRTLRTFRNVSKFGSHGFKC
jgi:hypothetical protein